MIKIRFSIVVPIYNVQEWLNECLISIINQTYKDYEVILVDDGSTDSSGEIAKTFAEGYSNFFYFVKENGGLSDARNYGINKSKGDYLIFVDSDDYLELNCLKLISKTIDQYPGIEIVEYNATVRSKDNLHKLNFVYSQTDKPIEGIRYMSENIKKRCIFAPAWLKCVNKKYLIDNNIYFKKDRIHEDELWTPKLYINASKIIYVDETLYNYRIRDNSITTKKDKSKNIEAIKLNCNELFNYYKKMNLKKSDKRVLYDYLARQYMRRWSFEGININKSKEDYIFLIKTSKTLKTLIKLLIFTTDIKLYKRIANKKF
ncbi:glycosyltransferase [Thomasclavelia sp.]|uniref:glycosyltransferase n=1 Tax=Thomasclavelia sp. TaxID=3025757 RepID=UPI002600C719|nr:glycosyltransferase [Thomasclavelia sp.]